TLVDVAAFALMRALPDNSLGLDELGPARGIVSIGAGVTNVVVHERGIPRFVRTLTIGGDDVTTAIAEELAIDTDMAEDLKRRADGRTHGDPRRAPGRPGGADHHSGRPRARRPQARGGHPSPVAGAARGVGGGGAPP